ncbi:MAG: amidohydrolase [Herminiimonas sp.]|nr:amidohydrolase [Herminiimonas sp.]
MKVIDVHAHVVPDGFPACPTCCKPEAWPAMERRDGGKSAVVIGGKDFRVLDGRSWNVDRRMTDMDIEDVTMQALSPMPELLSYWLEPAAALEMARHVNRAISEMVAAAPQRFVGLGMVPLQDPQMAAKELASFRDDYNLVGVEIGSNIGGRSPGDPFFDPFFAEAERLGLAIFVHALHPAGVDRLVGPAKRLTAFVNFPLDTGLAAASMITGRTLEKFPKLRIGFSHGGGTLASFLPRLASGWERMSELNSAFGSPKEAARRFYYDNIVFDPGLLRHLINTFGATQVFAGSDYPFVAGQSYPGQCFEQLGLTPAELELVGSGNARRFLGI